MSNDEDWQDVYERPMPRYALEEPIVGRTWMLETGELWDSNRPETELQALMESAPNETPEVSRQEMESRAERLQAALGVLTDEERAVIEVTVYAGHSIRMAAEILGWPRSTVHRLKKSAIRVIERELKGPGDVGEN